MTILRLLPLFCLLTLVACDASDRITVPPPPSTLDPGVRDRMTLRLELVVDDMQRSVNFYAGVLGFQVLHATSAYSAVQAGYVRMGLVSAATLPDEHFYVPDVTRARKGLGGELVFEVDDVANYWGAVSEVRYPVETPLQNRPGGISDFNLVDPDGYYVRITSVR